MELTQQQVLPPLEEVKDVSHSAADMQSLMQFESLTKESKEISFAKITPSDLGNTRKKEEFRRVPVPAHRYTPLKQHWETILKTLV